MAAGWLRQLSQGSIDVFSGGSSPATDINKTAVAAMQEIGIDITGERPKPWTDAEVRTADIIVSMGCGDTCPVYPGKRYLDWDLTDPSGQPIDVVREVRDDIEQRVRGLMASLDTSTEA
jgi:protein-tyrosine-phosphatase